MRADEITAELVATGFCCPNVRKPKSAETLDWRFESHDPDAKCLRVSFAAKLEFTNPGGTVQGGFIGAMFDEVMGPVVAAATAGEKMPVTTDMHITYFRPAKVGGRLLVEARVERLGGSVAFTSASMFGEASEVIAKCIQTARLVDWKPEQL